jgi:hypothetical protein
MVAVLENLETAIDMLDGLQFHHIRSQDGARYEVLPGRHMLSVSLFIVTYMSGGLGDIERSSTVATLCLDAQAGHRYLIAHEGRGEHWQPLITDAVTHAPVPLAPCS